MKIHSVELNNIKSFSETHVIDFSLSDKINTISGINGSGKTTIFKSIILAQKIFFLELLNDKETNSDNNDKELLNYFNKQFSYISLTFEFADLSLASFLVLCKKRTKNSIQIELIPGQANLNKIKEYWNVNNPRNLIIYIDSNRSIVEDDFSNKSIQINQQSAVELALQYIFNPEEIFFSTYNRFISDYLRERLIPSTPRADMAHYVAKILIADILDYLKINNFTALEEKEQFILQVKNTNTGGGFYDMRNLSSGEKTLFYIYHFICYIRNIGMLIIDEPENNLHENMLTKFVVSLHQICNSEKFSDLIISTAAKNDIGIRENLKTQITRHYDNHNLKQVFLLTHSKNLIYNNFSSGKNFVINGELQTIEYDNYEKKLREIGLSKIINKVLFVEGKTENELLQTIMASKNIKVKPLGGCGEVISTYKKYLQIASEIRDVQFCFMIDKDTRGDEDIDSIRNSNPAFFDEHFIIMDRHEIENYFLEPEIFHKLYTNHKKMFNKIVVPKASDIELRIRQIAENNKSIVLRKKLQSLNQKSLSKIKIAISGKNLPIDDEEAYKSHINSAFTEESLSKTIENIYDNFKQVDEIGKVWDARWKELCDGKTVLHEYVKIVSKDIELIHHRTLTELLEIGLSQPGNEINNIINKIYEILE